MTQEIQMATDPTTLPRIQAEKANAELKATTEAQNAADLIAFKNTTDAQVLAGGWVDAWLDQCDWPHLEAAHEAALLATGTTPTAAWERFARAIYASAPPVPSDAASANQVLQSYWPDLWTRLGSWTVAAPTVSVANLTTIRDEVEAFYALV